MKKLTRSQAILALFTLPAVAQAFTEAAQPQRSAVIPLPPIQTPAPIITLTLSETVSQIPYGATIAGVEVFSRTGDRLFLSCDDIWAALQPDSREARGR